MLGRRCQVDIQLHFFSEGKHFGTRVGKSHMTKRSAALHLNATNAQVNETYWTIS